MNYLVNLTELVKIVVNSGDLTEIIDMQGFHATTTEESQENAARRFALVDNVDDNSDECLIQLSS